MTITLPCGASFQVDDSFHKHHEVELHPRVFWRGIPADITWRIAEKNHTSYVVATVASRFELRLHRLLLNAPRNVVVDHIDHDGLNNLTSNLRLTTLAGNAQNRRPKRGRTVKGCCPHKDTGKWEAYIKRDKRKRHLGLFATRLEAAEAYNHAATSEFGDYAELNDLTQLN